MTTPTPLSAVDEYRHSVVRRAAQAVQDYELSPEKATARLAQLGIHVTFEVRPREGNERACNDTRCGICNAHVANVDRLDPLPDGTDLAAFKRRVFDVVTDIQEEVGWCGEGTRDALNDLGIETEFVDEDEDELQLAD